VLLQVLKISIRNPVQCDTSRQDSRLDFMEFQLWLLLVAASPFLVLILAASVSRLLGLVFGEL
jgi:hypothetical protein